MISTLLLALRITLSIVLYTFLISAFWVLWRDVRTRQERVSQAGIPSISLEHDGQISRFTTPEVMIGRAGTCDCILNDNTVSAQHSLLVYRESQWWLSDLDSTNGTFINENRIERPAVLRHGDLIRCGQVALGVDIETRM